MKGTDGFDLFAAVMLLPWAMALARDWAARKELAWPLYRKVEVAGRLLSVFGFVGLWVSKLIMQWLGMTEGRWMETPTGGATVWFFSGCLAIGLLALMPASLYLQKRSGVPLPGPRVPAWIAWPLIAVMILGFCLLLLLMLAAALQYLART